MIRWLKISKKYKKGDCDLVLEGRYENNNKSLSKKDTMHYANFKSENLSSSIQQKLKNAKREDFDLHLRGHNRQFFKISPKFEEHCQNVS